MVNGDHLLTLFASFIFIFTRAIAKGLIFGLCLYVVRSCNVHDLYCIELEENLLGYPVRLTGL